LLENLWRRTAWPLGRPAILTNSQQKLEESTMDNPDNDDERVPFMQRLLDNPFLLLFLGVAMPAVLYIIWGIMEITQIPIAK